jgi:phospholipase A1/A2
MVIHHSLFPIKPSQLKQLLRSLLLVLSISHIVPLLAQPITTPQQPKSTQKGITTNTQSKGQQSVKHKNERQRKIDELREKLYVKDSALAERIQEQLEATRSPFGIAFDEPTYMLPYYYTMKPDTAVYPPDQNPANQSIERQEFKAQLSLLVPVWHNVFKGTGLFVSYTQLSYWQFYAKSQYFRETDYEPAIFLRRHVLANAEWRLGLVHQSNGRGLPYERSWNRLFLDFRISGERWMISLKPWILVFKNDSSTLHNSDIADYLGYGRIILAYKIHHHTFSLMSRNSFESGFKRGAVELSWSFPLFSTKLKGMVQFFSGYGQSLIEYNHYTNSVGIGIALSDWI